jgi:hypothetical protein
LDFTPERVYYPEYVFQPQRGLACFKVNYEAHTNTGGQR